MPDHLDHQDRRARDSDDRVGDGIDALCVRLVLDQARAEAPHPLARHGVLRWPRFRADDAVGHRASGLHHARPTLVSGPKLPVT